MMMQDVFIPHGSRAATIGPKLGTDRVFLALWWNASKPLAHLRPSQLACLHVQATALNIAEAGSTFTLPR